MLSNIKKPIFIIPIIHFLLLSGYKLFSLYYPLFLDLKGFSLSYIGLNYFIIYFCVGFFSLLFLLLKKGNIKVLLAISVFGYSFYSISMLFVSTLFQFLLMQVLLGFFSGLFYVSTRGIILFKTKARTSEFQYFYLAPLISAILAPIIGGILIFIGNFPLAFLSSTFIYFITLFPIFKLEKVEFLEEKIKFKIKNKRVLVLPFVVMCLVGFYRGFFVLFLKNFGLTINQIIYLFFFANLILFLPLFFSARKLDYYDNKSLFFYFSIVFAITTILLGFVQSLVFIFILYLFEFSLSIFLRSEKSFLFGRLHIFKKQRSIVDTAIESFGVAFGALLGGLLLIYFTLSNLFIIFGVGLLIFTLVLKKF